MMGRAAVAVAAALFAASSAEAGVVAFHLTDEIADTKQYHVQIQADGYEEYTWEEGLNWICFPTGELIVSWKQGGQYSGYVVGRSGDEEIFYKLDDQPPGVFTFDDLNRGSRPKLRRLYEGMLNAKRLVLRRGPSTGISTAFKLAGFRLKAGPHTSFGKQCAAALSGGP